MRQVVQPVLNTSVGCGKVKAASWNGLLRSAIAALGGGFHSEVSTRWSLGWNSMSKYLSTISRRPSNATNFERIRSSRSPHTYQQEESFAATAMAGHGSVPSLTTRAMTRPFFDTSCFNLVLELSIAGTIRTETV